MPSTRPESDTAAWRDLLPWATPRSAEPCSTPSPGRDLFLGAVRRGLGGLRHLEAFAHPDALEALAAHHGHPTRLMDGEPLRRAPSGAALASRLADAFADHARTGLLYRASNDNAPTEAGACRASLHGVPRRVCFGGAAQPH